MSKYTALGEYLSKLKVARVQMSFADIEKIIGGKLPISQRYPAWWSNNPMNNTMTRVWLDAGFQTEQVDIAARKLIFRKASANETHTPLNANLSPNIDNVGDHPLFGCMSGTVHIPPGVDLTAPADPDWGDIAYGGDAPSQ